MNVQGFSDLKEIYYSDNSIVWTGINTTTGQKVAIKILNNEFPSHGMIARFNEEAELSQRFTDKAVKGVRKVEKQKIDNRHALVMEYVEGASLQDVLKEQVLNTERFLRLAINTSNIIGEIHKNGVIHKDVNPRNLLVSTDETVYVIDFGIASLYKKETQKMEAPERLEGTLAYISPEQTGRMNHSVDSRSDLYSLGITFYEMITGNLPFETNNAMELVHSHIAKVPETPKEKRNHIPHIVSRIIMKMISKNIEERYQTADGLKIDLEHCLEVLARDGESALEKLDFILGKQDFNTYFHIPEKLYGREQAKQDLLDAFLTTEAGGLAFLTVSGSSGIGKTALVRELFKPVTEKRSYFLSGKFEQFQRDVPYSAIVQAINGFVQHLLGESDKRLAHWKREILDSLGANAGVLTELIPNLELIIGKQPEPLALPPVESQNRFNTVFQKFFKDLSVPKHSLAVFIDDWQWADLSSLNLLKNLMTDAECKHLLFIAAYRHNEVDEAHPFMLCVKDIHDSNTPHRDFRLGELETKDIVELLRDTFNAHASDKVLDLAKLIKHKTSGNPFFVSQFLQNLYDGKHVAYNHKARAWEWNLQSIEQLPISNNVLDLMTARLKALSDETLSLVQKASCIGNNFSLKLLSQVVEQSQITVKQALMEALEQGFILPHKGNHYAVESEEDYGVYFRFLHDRVEQAANQFLSREAYAETQWKIGKLILDSATEAHIQENIFDIVNYLNNGRVYADSSTSLKRLADLNYQAGKKAKRSTAYATAKLLFTIALEGFGDNFWADDYAKAFDLHKELAEALFLQGNFEESDTYLALCLEKADTIYEKVEIYKIKIAKLSGQAKYAEALQIAIDAVRVFDIDLPNLDETVEMGEATGAEIGLYMEYIGKHNNDVNILGTLPECTNPDIIKGMELLGLALDCAVIGVPAALALVVMKMNNLSIQHGMSANSPVSFVFTAIIYASGFKDFKKASEIAELALLLAKGRGDIEPHLSKIYHIYGYFSPFLISLQESAEYHKKAFEKGLEIGDFVYGSYGIAVEARFLYLLSITKGEEKTQSGLSFFYKTNNVPMQLVMKMYLGFAKCMVGETKSQDSFDNDIFSEDDYTKAFETAATLLVGIYKRYKIQTLTILDFHENALKLVYERGTWIAIVGGLDVEWRSEYYLFTGLTVTSLYHECLEEINKKGIETYEKEIETEIAKLQTQLNVIEATEEQKQTIDELNYALYVLQHKLEPTKYVEILQECIDELQLLLDCSDNFLAQHSLLCAEKARIEGDRLRAMDAYDEAIEAATKMEIPQYVALAAERAGVYYIHETKHNKKDAAKVYLQKALYAYAVWGATAKVEQMRVKYKEYVGSRKDTRTTNTLSMMATVKHDSMHTSSYGDNALDLVSVMKASQTISQDIKLESLLRNMAMVLMENAGAERILFIQDVEGDMRVAVEADIDKKEIEVLNPTPLSNDDRERVALSIIRQVYRTHETIVCQNAKKDNRFTMDHYVQHQNVKSLLCFPIMHQNKVRMVIYMEHNTVEGAFTSDRIEVLNMLSSQVAISIENAMLYETMEQKVAQRTSELAKVNEELVHKNTNITSSIKYALRMQQAILPTEEEMKQVSEDYFALYLPKDIVSGDFYWYAKIQEKHLVAAIDCTGHGVPGAFMSMIANTLLDEIVNQKEVTGPASILEQLHKGVRIALNQDVSNNNDGMDMCLCTLEKQANGQTKMLFSGAKNSLYYVKEGEYNSIEADRRSIGGQDSKNPQPFQTHTLMLEKGDVFYLSTDGYIDQAGGAKRMAFSRKRLIETIKEHWQKSMQVQREVFQKALAEHQGGIPQRDDITLIGFRIA